MTKSKSKTKVIKAEHKVRAVYDSDGEPWPDIPVDPQPKQKENNKNYREIPDTIKGLQKQKDIQNEYFRKWKYEKTLETTAALQFFKGEMFKFEVHLRNHWESPLIVETLESFPADIEKIITLINKRISVLKRYLEEIRKAGAGENTTGDVPDEGSMKKYHAELAKEMTNKEKMATIFLVNKEKIISRGSGTPSSEPQYMLKRGIKVTHVYRMLNTEIENGHLKISIDYIPDYMKKTMLQSDGKTSVYRPLYAMLHKGKNS